MKDINKEYDNYSYSIDEIINEQEEPNSISYTTPTDHDDVISRMDERITEIGGSVDSYVTTNTAPEEFESYFITANQRSEIGKHLPSRKALFGSYWKENQLAILAGDTGAGKSVLAVAIADAITNNNINTYLNHPVESTGVVLYLDFELSDEDWIERYRDYKFSDNLYFIRGKDLGELFISSEPDDIFDVIRGFHQYNKFDVLIIDNLISLLCVPTTDADLLIRFVTGLNRIIDELKISILLIAHTPKIDFTKPLTSDSVAGTKNLAILVDSIFFIAKSIDSTDDIPIRYIKQTKSRAAKDRVSVDIVKFLDNDFLHLEFIKEDKESKHLQIDRQADDISADIDWQSIFQDNDTMNRKDIVDILKREYNIPERSADRLIKKYLNKIGHGLYSIE